jgi:hypothetical protein
LVAAVELALTNVLLTFRLGSAAASTPNQSRKIQPQLSCRRRVLVPALRGTMPPETVTHPLEDGNTTELWRTPLA